MINHAVEVRLEAERKAGALIAELGERRGKTSSERSFPSNTDLGVTDKQSHFWQALAALDDEAFLARLKDAQRAAASAIELTADERKREKQARRVLGEIDIDPASQRMSRRSRPLCRPFPARKGTGGKDGPRATRAHPASLEARISPARGPQRRTIGYGGADQRPALPIFEG